MKRNIKKQFWFNAEEAKDLKTKAEKAFITEAALVRMLLKGERKAGRQILCCNA